MAFSYFPSGVRFNALSKARFRRGLWNRGNFLGLPPNLRGAELVLLVEIIHESSQCCRVRKMLMVSFPGPKAKVRFTLGVRSNRAARGGTGNRAPGLFLIGVLPLLLAAASPALAVSMDKSSSTRDLCAVRVGAGAIQISGYQPDYSQDKYCEEFPSPGKTILVFDLESPSMRERPIEVRIVKDGLGSRSEGVDLAARTEAYIAPRTYPSGTLTLEHDFTENGRFIILMTLTKPNGDKETAQFKFAVGQTLLHYAPVALGGFLIASMLFLFWKHSSGRSKAAS
jgi:hypothetical protein